MEFKLTLPGGLTVEYKKQPMSQARFESICWLIGIFLIGSGLLKFFAMLTGM